MNRYHLIFAIACLCFAPVNANEVLISPLSVGSYTSVGASILPEADSMLVANVSGFVAHSYMVFDANEIDRRVFSLELRGNSGDGSGRGSDVVVAFHPFSGSVSELTGGTIDFDDLVDPQSYAEFLSPGITPNDTDFSIGLSSAAVADFNSSSGTFVITASQPVGTATSGFLGGVTAGEISLVAVTIVPEPSCLALLSCVAMSATVRRRHR